LISSKKHMGTTCCTFILLQGALKHSNTRQVKNKLLRR
jgi:hypothetical protein